MDIEYQIICHIDQFCNQHGVTIDALPDGYLHVLAFHINTKLFGESGNVTILNTEPTCDLHIVAQPSVVHEWKIIRLNHKDLEVAMVMAS